MKKNKICTKGIWNETIPGIHFSNDGSSNYSKIFSQMEDQYPRAEKGKKDFDIILKKIKKQKGKYDCLIGISGGTDSSYLMHIAKKTYGLNPLAVTFDNGWNSDISVKNIKKMTSALGIDLETYVVDYEEMKDLLKSYMKASLPWIDFPTDHAIKSILYKLANREGIKHILIGHDFRSEGTQPREWTYGDSKQIKYIQKNFGTIKLKTYPNISIFKQFYLGYIKKIKIIYPFFFIDYNKNNAQKFLKENYDWQYYGGHHHENIFTKYAISYWMKNKFNIDKRLITLSAQLMSGEIDREYALNEISFSPYNTKEIDNEINYLIKKLDLSKNEYNLIWEQKNKGFEDYPSYFPIIIKVAKLIKPLVKLIMPQVPSFFYQIDNRNEK